MFFKQNIKVYINHTVNPDHWDKKRQRSINDRYLNDLLEDLKVKVLGAYRRYYQKGDSNKDKFKAEVIRIVRMENVVPLLDYVDTELLKLYNDQFQFTDTDFFKASNRIERYYKFLKVEGFAKSKILNELLKVRSKLDAANLGYDSLSFSKIIEDVKKL